MNVLGFMLQNCEQFSEYASNTQVQIFAGLSAHFLTQRQSILCYFPPRSKLWLPKASNESWKLVHTYYIL